MNTKQCITINEKNIMLPVDNGTFQIGTLLIDFLELDLAEYQNSIEQIKKYDSEDMQRILKKRGRFSQSYAPLMLQLSDDMTDREKYTRISLYNALKATGHPYAFEIDYPSLNHIKYTKLFDIFDLVKLQKEYRKAVEFCLLKQEESEVFNPLEKYYNYNNKLNGNAEIVYTVSEDYTMHEEYISSDISSLLYIEFTKMLQYSIFVYRCENCGKLFAIKGNYNKKYCDRIIEGTSKTCQKAGATNSFKKKMLKDPIIGEYQRAYKRLYARKRTGKISKEELDQQIKKATLLRDKAVKGSLVLKDYLDQIIKI